MRSLLRLAWRSLWKNKLRTALVVALVAIPVASATAVASLQRTFQPTVSEQTEATMGHATAMFTLHRNHNASGSAEGDPAPVPDVAGAMAQIASETGAVTQYNRTTFTTELSNPYRDFNPASLSDPDLNDPLLAGILTILEGAAPQTDTGVAISRAVAEETKSRIGDELTLNNEPYVVSAITVVPTDADHPSIVMTPSGLDRIVDEYADVSWRLRIGGNAANTRQEDWLMKVAGDLVAVPANTERHWFVRVDTRFRASGMVRSVDPGQRPEQLSTLLAAVIAIEVALIAAAAFSVGMRRRVQEFGQLLAMGADGRHVRKLLLLEAGLQGLVAAVVGSGVGLLAAQVIFSQGWIEPNRWAPTLRFTLVDALGPAAIAVVAALAAAWLPARTASGLPVTSALAGRLPSRVPSRIIPKVGLALLVLGTLFLILVLTGVQAYQRETNAFVVLIGLAIAAMFAGVVSVVSLLLNLVARFVNRFATRLPLPVRLITRNSDRQRARAGAAVAAFVAIAALPVLTASATMAFTNSDRVGEAAQSVIIVDLANSQPPSPLTDAQSEQRAAQRSALLQAIDDEMGPTMKVDYQALTGIDIRLMHEQRGGLMISSSGWGSSHDIGIITSELIDALGLDPTLLQTLQPTEALMLGNSKSFDSYWPADGRSTLTITAGTGGTSAPLAPLDPNQDLKQTTTFDVVSAGDDYYGLGLLALVTPEAAATIATTENIGLSEAVLLVAPSPATAAQVERIQNVMGAEWSGSDARAMAVRFTPHLNGAPSKRVLTWVPVALMALLATIISLVVASLAAVETDRDFGSMIASGAAPSIRRWMLGAQTTYHMVLAALLGVPLALLIFALMLNSEIGERDAWPIPWSTIFAMVVLVPVVVGLLVALLFRSGRPVVSRRLT